MSHRAKISIARFANIVGLVLAGTMVYGTLSL